MQKFGGGLGIRVSDLFLPVEFRVGSVCLSVCLSVRW